MSSAGPEVVELAQATGLRLDPWQVHDLDVILAERVDGNWAAFETAEVVARQNGKGGIIEALGLGSLFLFESERLTLYSAHEFKTAHEHFLRLMGLIENAPELRKLCKKPRTSHGEEGFERLDGKRLRFVARSRSSGRGFTGDRIILDEAQELPRSAMGAMLPTLSARPNPQVNYFGTVPEETDNSEHLESLRDRGRSGEDESLAWIEYSPEPVDGTVDLDDRVNWREANPALGIRISEEHIARERASLDDEQFARERLSVWGAGASGAVIDPDAWQQLTDPDSKRGSKVAFAVDVSPDRKTASIAVASDRKDRMRHVELVPSTADGQWLSGTSWIVGRLVELAGKWKGEVVLDPAGPAGSLIVDLMEAGIEPQLVSGREMAQACGAFYDLTVDRKVIRHLGQPKLNVAVDAGRKRTLQDAWAWHRRDATADITPLVAVTLASHALGLPPKRREYSDEASFF